LSRGANSEGASRFRRDIDGCSCNGASVFAQQTGAAQQRRAAKGNRLRPSEVYEFLTRLQKAVASDNKEAVSSLVAYPLNVIVGRHRRKVNKSLLLSQYDQIFTPKVKHALASQRSDQLFIKSTGFMVGRGEVWFDEADDGHF
jgi:hypothetical protein